MYWINTPDGADPRFSHAPELDGKEFIFEFDYQIRRDVWVLTIKRTDGVILLPPRLCETGYDLMSSMVTPDAPGGRLFVMARSPLIPARYDWQAKRASLVYVEAEESLA